MTAGLHTKCPHKFANKILKAEKDWRNQHDKEALESVALREIKNLQIQRA